MKIILISIFRIEIAFLDFSQVDLLVRLQDEVEQRYVRPSDRGDREHLSLERPAIEYLMLRNDLEEDGRFSSSHILRTSEGQRRIAEAQNRYNSGQICNATYFAALVARTPSPSAHPPYHGRYEHMWGVPAQYGGRRRPLAAAIPDPGPEK